MQPVEALRQTEFFQDFDDRHFDKLMEISRLVEYPARATLFHQYDVAKDVFVVVSGKVSLATCSGQLGCRQMMEVGPGELLGWSPLLARPRLSDTASTLTPVTAMAFDGQQLLAYCAEDTTFGFEFMRRVAEVLAQRLSATRLRLLEMSGMRLPEVQVESD